MSVTTITPAITNPTYQWYSNSANNNTSGTKIANATGPTYIANITTTTYYYCVVGNGDCPTAASFTSTPCSVTVTAAIIPTAVAINAALPSSVASGGSSTLSVQSISPASVTNPTYQWWSTTTNNNTSGSAIAGATSADYVATNITTNTYYYCKVTANGTTVVSTQTPVTVTSKTTACGAYTIPSGSPAGATIATAGSVWRQFMCYNLGADETFDPLTPSKGLIGNYYQWNKKTPIGTVDVLLPSWEASYTTTATSWEAANDPCPAGFTVPSQEEWQGIVDYYGPPTTSTWLNLGTVYTCGWKVGNYLFLPAAGTINGGWYNNCGINGAYWSSTVASNYAYFLNSTSSAVNVTSYDAYTSGMSIRCLIE
jgi:uncharacterized protein (TIGR02145 family)